MLLAMDLEAILEEHGCHALGPACSVKSALALLEDERPDVVSLDMNLRGKSSAPVAAALRQSNIPFVVVTGYSGKHREDPMFRDAPLVKKPYDSTEYIAALVQVLA